MQSQYYDNEIILTSESYEETIRMSTVLLRQQEVAEEFIPITRLDFSAIAPFYGELRVRYESFDDTYLERVLSFLDYCGLPVFENNGKEIWNQRRTKQNKLTNLTEK